MRLGRLEIKASGWPGQLKNESGRAGVLGVGEKPRWELLTTNEPLGRFGG